MANDDDLRYVPHLGLALGGGGALGAAHVGVMQVLHERGIIPEVITGTSAGSIAGGATALGLNPYALEDRIYEWGWQSFGTWTPKPGFGLMTHDGLARGVINVAGTDPNIEDLPIRFGAVATDIEAREAVVIDHGSLTEAVAASIAVPGVFRPVHIEGRSLLDGGLVQNLPIEACFGLGADHVIAVRLAAEWDLRGFGNGFEVHEWEIRSDVTVITPRVGKHSQWVIKGLPDLVQAGREAAEAEFRDYPVINPRPPRPRIDTSVAPSGQSDAAASPTATPDLEDQQEDRERTPARRRISGLLRRR
ncbi:patatin-like phospholipase family protein [Demequina sediminicola]|uniref:patatin-like phospholipase family protein n=1 Tax=Demequina sediminicola TaxID=1095026 RepID=UPI0007862A47|nr:patatin-like phospholipase family protein [Demequina sediminicola]